MKKYALYRFYGDTGQLIYVGISSDPARRFGQHAATKAWWESVRGISLEWYTSRRDLEAAERRAIEIERPLMNLQRPRLAATPAGDARCGHCIGCVSKESPKPPCYVHNNPDPDPYCEPCPECGSATCLYAVGYSHGEQIGWSRGWNSSRERSRA